MSATHNDLHHDFAGEKVAHLLQSAPGIDSLVILAAIDPFSLSSPSRIDYLGALEKQSGWLQSLLQNAIIAVAGEQPGKSTDIFSGVDDAEREEIATTLRLSGTVAQQRIDVARILTQNLPGTTSALANGEISLGHANVIAKECAEIIRAERKINRFEKLKI